MGPVEFENLYKGKLVRIDGSAVGIVQGAQACCPTDFMIFFAHNPNAYYIDSRPGHFPTVEVWGEGDNETR